MIIARKHLKKSQLKLDEGVIGSYKFLKSDLLGAGNESKVYKGVHIIENYEVAVKVIDSSEIEDNLSKKLLKNSLVSLETLKNTPHILDLHEIYYSEKFIYVITQLCSGDLSSRIKNGVAEDQALRYLEDLVKGYKSMYDAGIVHRDIKPDNIFINDQGQAKIGDFGFSGPLYQVKRQVYYSIGSPAYMAPETLLRNQYSYQSDIWAIGISFYEMLKGQLPWTSLKQDKVKAQMCTEFINRKINSLQISTKSKQFLTRSLEVNKNLRMSPHELLKFFSLEQEQDEKQLQKQIQDMSTNWSFSNFGSKDSFKNKSRMTDNSFSITIISNRKTNISNDVKNKTKEFKNQSPHALLTPNGFKRPKGILNQLLSPQKQLQKTKITEFLCKNKNEDIKLKSGEKKKQNRDINKILNYFLDMNNKIYEFFKELNNSSAIKRLYSEQIVLMRVCLKNILIKTSQKIMNVSNSNILQPFASMIDISTYSSSQIYATTKKVCSEQIQKLQAIEQFSLYWPKAKEQNIIGAINATTCFLKKIKQTLSHYYQKQQNKQLLAITSLCLIMIQKMICLLSNKRFEEIPELPKNDSLKQGLELKNKILQDINLVIKQVKELQ